VPTQVAAAAAIGVGLWLLGRVSEGRVHKGG
jgi:hypothetical protein